jgi:transposase
MTLEPLADYLEPRFGNIYYFALTAVVDFVKVRPWNPALEQAIRRYLVHEAAGELYARFLDALEYSVPDGSREEQARAIVQKSLPWQIAFAFHLATVRAITTLDELIGDLDRWEDTDQRWDTAEWLGEHASQEQLAELAAHTNYPELDTARPWHESEPEGRHFAWNLSPPELLKAWRYVAGPASSDLTDAEWEMLVPLLPQRWNERGPVYRSTEEWTSVRRAINGIRYKFACNVEWFQVPSRYGHWSNIRQRYYLYKRKGVFTRMVQSLRDVPETVLLMEWMEKLCTPNE